MLTAKRKRYLLGRVFNIAACAATVQWALPLVGVKLVEPGILAVFVPGVLFNAVNLGLMWFAHEKLIKPMLQEGKMEKRPFNPMTDEPDPKMIGLLWIGIVMTVMPALVLWLLLAASPTVIGIEAVSRFWAFLSGGVLMLADIAIDDVVGMARGESSMFSGKLLP